MNMLYMHYITFLVQVFPGHNRLSVRGSVFSLHYITLCYQVFKILNILKFSYYYTLIKSFFIGINFINLCIPLNTF